MKFYTLEDSQLVRVNDLMRRRVDGEYVVLRENNNFTDIAQYSGKYCNVHVITVPTDRLDPGMRLA